MSNFVKGNQFQLFYYNGTKWAALAYATSHSISLGGYETAEIACKEFGLTPQKEMTKGAEPPEVSGEYLYSKEAWEVFCGMHESNKEYSFCFAEVSTWSEANGYTVGTATGAVVPASVSSATFKYFNGYVSAVSISSEVNSNATMSITITGKTKVSDSVQTGTGLLKYQAA